MDEELQGAIDVLSIDAIAIRSSASALHNGYDPKFDDDRHAITVELKSRVDEYEVVKTEGRTPQLFLCVGVDCRMELVRELEESNGAADSDSKVMIASVDAKMVAYYSMAENPGGDALEKFALQNASFHVWPYWREYLANQCLRMNLSPVMLPMRQFVR